MYSITGKSGNPNGNRPIFTSVSLTFFWPRTADCLKSLIFGRDPILEGAIIVLYVRPVGLKPKAENPRVPIRLLRLRSGAAEVTELLYDPIYNLIIT